MKGRHHERPIETVIHRFTMPWPTAGSARGVARPIRLLAVSDDRDPSLERSDVRTTVGPIDLIVGCGDLEPDYLSMLGDALMAPLVYVRGNHDRGIGWTEGSCRAPDPMPDARPIERADLRLAGLSWPGRLDGRAERDEKAAWRQALALAARTAMSESASLVLISHVPPQGLGDAADAYHRGFPAYRWLLGRLRPRLWLHGHTHRASCVSNLDVAGATNVLNVTAATLIELTPVPAQGALPEAAALEAKR